MKNKIVTKENAKRPYHAFKVYCADGDEVVSFVVYCIRRDFEIASILGEEKADKWCDDHGREHTFLVDFIKYLGISYL